MTHFFSLVASLEVPWAISNSKQSLVGYKALPTIIRIGMTFVQLWREQLWHFHPRTNRVIESMGQWGLMLVFCVKYISLLIKLCNSWLICSLQGFEFLRFSLHNEILIMVRYLSIKEACLFVFFITMRSPKGWCPLLCTWYH